MSAFIIFFRAFTGKFNKNTEAGLYTCVVCDEELFTSETKFDSGCGWPAFNDVIDQKKVKLTTDTSNGMWIGRKFMVLVDLIASCGLQKKIHWLTPWLFSKSKKIL